MSRDLVVSFGGGKKVKADYKGFTIETDQPVDKGGENSAPAPFDLFLASLGTCAGLYVLGFCQARKIDPDSVSLRMRPEFEAETGVLSSVTIDIDVPPDFPERYVEWIARVAGNCAVKKAIQAGPEFVIRTNAREADVPATTTV